jgi:pre-60S factor REI1
MDFFIPEIEYLKDIEGLIKYLGEKISIGNTCIWCEKTFYSIEATQAHMVTTKKKKKNFFCTKTIHFNLFLA